MVDFLELRLTINKLETSFLVLETLPFIRVELSWPNPENEASITISKNSKCFGNGCVCAKNTTPLFKKWKD